MRFEDPPQEQSIRGVDCASQTQRWINPVTCKTDIKEWEGELLLI